MSDVTVPQIHLTSILLTRVVVQKQDEKLLFETEKVQKDQMAEIFLGPCPKLKVVSRNLIERCLLKLAKDKTK